MRNVHAIVRASEEFSDDPDAGMVAQSITDHISTGVVFLNDVGIITFVNGATEEMLRVPREEAVGRRVDMLPLRTPLYKVLSESCRDTAVEVSFEGSVFLVSSSSIVVAETGPRGELFEIRDITEEKREKRQREEFVAMMTHDLKSPLTVMMGYIQAMKGEIVGPVEQTANSRLFVDELDRSSNRLLNMIEDVLDAYRLEVGLLAIHKEPENLVEVLVGCCHDISREMLQKRIDFSVSIADDLPLLRLDRKQIVRVFANLLGNALKFTPPGGKVALAAENRPEHVEITVCDTGIGIPEKDLGRVFNKYFRSRSAAGYKGTGLGLAISKVIVDAHGGAIRVESQEGKGSTFTIILPVE